MSYYTNRKNRVDEKLIAKARQFRELFFNREDKVPVAPHPHWEMKPPIIPVAPTDLEDALIGHLFGPKFICPSFIYYGKKLPGVVRLGTYSLAADSTCIWGCIDIDGAGGNHKYPVKDANQTAIRILKNIKSHGLPVYLVRSGGGCGWHIWIPPHHGFLGHLIGVKVPEKDGGCHEEKPQDRGDAVFCSA
jgi:hypothetical protein